MYSWMSAAASGPRGVSRSPTAATAAAWVGIPTFDSSYIYRQLHSNSSIFGPRNGPTFNSGTSIRLLSLGPTDGTSRDHRDRWWDLLEAPPRRGLAGLVICCCRQGPRVPPPPVPQVKPCWEDVRVFTLVRGVRPRYTCSISVFPFCSCQNTRASSHSVTIIEIHGHMLICPFAKGAMTFMIY